MLDTTPGGTNSNSYVTLREVEEYIEERDAAALDRWRTIGRDEPGRKLQEEVVKFGAVMVDALSALSSAHEFVGEKYSEHQALAFPRAGESVAIPNEVKKAQLAKVADAFGVERERNMREHLRSFLKRRPSHVLPDTSSSGASMSSTSARQGVGA